MSKSLQDQLLKAGLVTEQQAKKAKKDLHKQSRSKKTKAKTKKPKNPKGVTSGASSKAAPADLKPYDLQETAAERANRLKEEKKRRDQALEKKRKANAEVREKQAQMRQLLKVYSVDREEGDSVFQFLMPSLGKSVKRIRVSESQQLKLANGQLGVVWSEDKFILVKPEGAQKISERDKACVYWVDPNHQSRKTSKKQDGDDQGDDPYAGYEIPDDLMW